MTTANALTHAQMLIGQSRYDLAERELKTVLSQNPQHAEAHALMAICRLQHDDHTRAKQHAKQAIGQSPDMPLSHQVLAHCLLEEQDYKQARQAAGEAIRLSPYDPNSYALAGHVELADNQTEQALEYAEQGLAIDPENNKCTNLRGMVMTKLGRKEEARASIQAALENQPEDSYAHANLGWSKLHSNETKQALVHFKEALRLDPGNDWAKGGLVEALKARNPIYRLLLSYFLWMNRLSPRTQNGVIIGGFIGYFVARRIANEVEGAGTFLWPLIGLYLAFVVTVWVAVPLFNLLLQLSPYGRHALSRDQHIGSLIFGGYLVFILGYLAALGAGMWQAPGSEWVGLMQAHAIQWGLITLMVGGVAMLVGEKRFWLFGPATAGLMVVVAVLMGLGMPRETDDLVALMRGGLYFVWLFGSIGVLWGMALGGGK